MHTQARRVLVGVALTGIVAGLGACRVGGSASASDENDRLRREAIELRDKVKRLEGEAAELRAKLPEPGATGVTREALAALPVCTTVEVDSLSGRRADGSIAVWFVTRDGRGRFTPAVGAATVEAIVVPKGSPQGAGADNPALSRVALDAPGLREAYRSGITGTNYEVVLPPAPAPAPGPSILIRVRFDDALTGRTIWGSRVLELK